MHYMIILILNLSLETNNIAKAGHVSLIHFYPKDQVCNHTLGDSSFEISV